MIYDELYPCSTCEKPVTYAQNALECDNCFKWTHIRCNKLDKKGYEYHNKHPEAPFTCLNCLEDNVPLSKLDNNQFNLLQKYGVNYITDENNLNYAPRVRDQKLFIEVNKTIYNTIHNINSAAGNDDDTDDDDDVFTDTLAWILLSLTMST